MGIVRFALEFPHTFYVVAALILFLGIVACREMRTDVFPLAEGSKVQTRPAARVRQYFSRRFPKAAILKPYLMVRPACRSYVLVQASSPRLPLQAVS